SHATSTRRIMGGSDVRNAPFAGNLAPDHSDVTNASNVSLTVNYLPSKFSATLLTPGGSAMRKGKNGKGVDPIVPKRGGGLEAFRNGEARMGYSGKDDYGNIWMEKPYGKRLRLRWNRLKWVLFFANILVRTSSPLTSRIHKRPVVSCPRPRRPHTHTEPAQLLRLLFPLLEATVTQTCYTRSVLPRCKKPYIDFQHVVLHRWFAVAFVLVPFQLAVMIAALLCSNHVTYRFGKDMMPKRYRLSTSSMAVIMDNYASPLAERHGADVADDILKRSRDGARLKMQD
ncbi:hypothetical protein C0993_006942, partial [Termitomyces sp. T159_Od127]